MGRWLPGSVILVFLAVGLCAAQEPPSKKGDEPGKSNSAPPTPPKRTTKPDDSEPFRGNLSSVPAGGKVWISPEQFKELEDRNQKLREQLSALDRQLKKEKLPPSACKLTGRLDGDVVSLRAEILFSTSGPQTTIFLGLKNAYLVDEGQIDDGVPHLEANDDGYFVRVDKEGAHRMTLSLRVAVVAKRGTGAAAANERGFDLGLPASAVTTLALELPGGVKDLRCNDNVQAPKSPGVWDVTLGAQKSLGVVWKEPAAAATANVGPSARANLKVKLEEGRVEIAGELILEDAKNPTREWQVLLPAQVKVSPAAGSAAFTIAAPDRNSNTYLIRLAEPAERITLSLQVQYVKTLAAQRIPVGPILVQGTATQGTILIQSAPGVLRGQRLLYHRFGEIFQRDPPKAPTGVENLAQFQFWNAPFSGKGLSPAKASLELEWKTERGQIDASAEYDVKLREDRGQWLVDIETKFHVQSANSGLDTLELQTPAQTYPDLLWLGVQPSLGFPAALRWPVALAPRPAFPLSMIVLDDGGAIDVPAADAQHRVRLKLSRPIGKEMVVKVQSRLLAAGDGNRFVLDLPKLVGVLDRGAKVTVWTPPGQEFLAGSAAQPEPFHDKFQQSFEQTPPWLELAWRGSQRERLARAVVDLTVRENAVQVRQTLILPVAVWSGGATQTGQIALHLPSPGFTFSAINVSRLSYDKSVAWIKLPAETKGNYEIQFEYDIPFAKKGDGATPIPLLWPDDTTSREAKLRIWTEPGATPKLVGLGELWKDRPLEEGPNPGTWPALVAVGLGPSLPLAIELEQSAGHRLPVMVADRSLVQVRVDDEGALAYRCRFSVRKFGAASLDVELPVAWHLGQPRFRIAGKDVGGVKVVDPLRNRVRLPLAIHLYTMPVLLEIDYLIPADQVDGKRFWQTPLTPPRFESDVLFGTTRWQIALPGNQTPLVLGSASVDYQWVLSGWLLSPETSVASADLDAWIGSSDAADGEAVSLAWWRSTVDPQRVYHFPRQFWLVACSGIVLVLGMLILLTPMPRYMTGLIVLAIGLSIVSLGLFHEYLLPTLLLGCQPGIVVLTVIGAIQWILHERHRRQMNDMPSFSRVPQGSTLIRGPAKPPRGPSTVDAPVAGPGSVKGSAH